MRGVCEQPPARVMRGARLRGERLRRASRASRAARFATPLTRPRPTHTRPRRSSHGRGGRDPTRPKRNPTRAGSLHSRADKRHACGCARRRARRLAHRVALASTRSSHTAAPHAQLTVADRGRRAGAGDRRIAPSAGARRTRRPRYRGM